MIKLFEWMLYSTIIGFWLVFVIFAATYVVIRLIDWIEEKRKYK